MRDYGCDITSDEAAEMFHAFDVDASGTVSFDELLVALRYNLGHVFYVRNIVTSISGVLEQLHMRAIAYSNQYL